MQNIIFFIREHLILHITWLTLLLLIIMFMVQHFRIKHVFVNQSQVKILLDHDNGVIVDTRLKEIFNTIHIANSINIPLENILSGNIPELEPYKNFPVILIISTPHTLCTYTEKLYQHGFHSIYILKNGIDSWTAEHPPLINTGK